jgi:hypothetical protein
MAKKTQLWIALILTCLSVLSHTASAGGGAALTIVCTVVEQVMEAFTYVAPSLVIIMFLYGGIKYAFSSDDPGGRKQGKMICIHAVVGGILILLVEWVATILLNQGLVMCPGMATTMT